MKIFPPFAKATVIACIFCGLLSMFVTSFWVLKEKMLEQSHKNTVVAGMRGLRSAEADVSVMSAPAGSVSFSISQEQAGEIGQLMRKLQTSPDDTETLIAISELFMEAQEWGRAETFLNRAILNRPFDKGPRYMLGIALFRQNKASEAARTFEELIQVSEDPAALYNLAVLYKHHLGQPEKAAMLLQRALESPETDTDRASVIRQELSAP